MWPTEQLLSSSSILNEEQKEKLREEFSDKLIVELTKEAEKIPLSESIPTALDWINGRRTPDANQEIKSAISNLSLSVTASALCL